MRLLSGEELGRYRKVPAGCAADAFVASPCHLQKFPCPRVPGRGRFVLPARSPGRMNLDKCIAREIVHVRFRGGAWTIVQALYSYS